MILAPAGALKKMARSSTHAYVLANVNVMPVRVALMRFSRPLVSGSTIAFTFSLMTGFAWPAYHYHYSYA
jgi:hypothetical protein